MHKRLSIQHLMIAYIMPMFTIFQDYYTLGGEERRRIERMMSMCLTWFPISGLGEPYIYHDSGVFYKNRGRFPQRTPNMRNIIFLTDIVSASTETLRKY